MPLHKYLSGKRKNQVSIKKTKRDKNNDRYKKV